jgi:hypothetical protein
MTAAEFTAWQRRCGYRTDAETAAALRLSAGTIYRYRHGASRVSPPVALLCELVEQVRFLDPLRLAELGDLINKLIRLAISRR